MPHLYSADSLSQDAINGRLYGRRDLVREYAVTHLTPPETVAFVRYHDDFLNRRVLDIGCGGGRLAVNLRPLTNAYVGLDYSPHMISHCRRDFPDLEFHHGDMRSLAGFDAGSFDTVLGVFNVLDIVSHEDRLVVLQEVRRVLKPNGLFFFSSHNRNSLDVPVSPTLKLSRNPFTCMRCLAEYVQARFNHYRFRTQNRFEPEYAILNDSGHNFAVLHYYVGRDAQERQLKGAGFHLVECLDEMGRTLREREDDSTNTAIHYLARREM